MVDDMDDTTTEDGDLEEETSSEDFGEDVTEIEENNYGTYVIVLGVIITIGVLGLKVAAIASGSFEILGVEVADKIYTGGDHFSTYFFSGLIVGILVIIIGLVTTSQAKKEPTEEEKAGFGEGWTEEEEEEGICPTCGAVIPIDSEVCPECGEELAPPEEEEVIEEEVIEEEVEEEIIECPICGAEISADAEECPECGEPLADLEEEEEDLFEDL